MTTGIVISCFDLTGAMVAPWAEAGYRCYCVDVQHPPGETWSGNVVRVGADVRDWLPPRQEIAFAAFLPPCTDVAASGARWFKDKGLGRLVDALELFDWSLKVAEWTGAPYLIENPVNNVYVKQYGRGADERFDPCDYAGYVPEGPERDAEAYTKKTLLWTGGGFVMPHARRVEPVLGSKMHLLPPSAARANLRSATPRGFARAVFQANNPDIAAIAA